MYNDPKMRSCFQYSSALLITLLAGFALAQRGYRGRRCGPGEQFSQCSTACPAVCGQPPPEACPYKCVIGCVCRRGLIRAFNGWCVPEPLCVRRG
ncbi:chymotrypsin-elastase inhibitor ixodidin-like isoform X2 [Dermacentor silvarum]|uniref:chymotrypsin-elastase inhibitor ixodidin-like isoform X2 n=1 Tax=Dermacentor silvarum TaxID=543639 RepID=UPI00210185A5|nr:chymotrypsin-elastase inhibitor ixodidin-like isoform X2 [Dermacentor silvarum]